ncbi:MAG: hypothetical protein V9H69_23975 [Anaerolineae bacterium]
MISVRGEPRYVRRWMIAHHDRPASTALLADTIEISLLSVMTLE